MTASLGLMRTADAPLDETTKIPRRHSSNSSQDELRKEIESNLPVTSLKKKKKKATFLMRKYLFTYLQMPPNGHEPSCLTSDVPSRN